MDRLYMKYFVLKPRGTDAYAEASRRAMAIYADSIMEENRSLSLDLIKWVQEEDRIANPAVETTGAN